MPKNVLSLLCLATMAFIISCSSTPKRNQVSIVMASSGPVKNKSIPFPLYLTDKLESRSEVESKTSQNVFIVHTGHILSASSSKKQNEETLTSLIDKGIDVVNLTLEDFIIADSQGISFEKYPQQFLNSSVVDLNEDNFIKKSNINPYFIHDGVALIGLSDKKLDKKTPMGKFLVSDYALAVLRAKKSALKDSRYEINNENPLNSFVIIHTIGADINEVMERLPSNFINSLAN